MGEVPNRLDAVLARLEAVARDRVEQPMRFLRELINEARAKGTFNEDRLANEIEELASRDRDAARRGFQLGEEIEYLTNRLREKGFP